MPQNRTMFISSPPPSLEFFFLVGGRGGRVILSDDVKLNRDELNILVFIDLKSEAQSAFVLILCFVVVLYFCH